MNKSKDIFNHIEKANSTYDSDKLSLREVLKLPIFEGHQILAGEKGLDNSCKDMSILETPEGISWSKGDEFLLTAGYAFRNDKQAKENIIIQAHENKVVAIGIKENRYFGEISDKLINDANKYNILLIKIPYNTGYTDAIASFYNLLFYKKNEYILNLNNIYEKLLDLTFENKDIDGIIGSISELSNSNILLINDKFDIISKNLINDKRDKNIMDFLESIIKDKDSLERLSVPILNFKFKENLISSYPIIRDNEKIGFLCLIKENELDELQQSVIEYGLPIISMKLEKQWLIKVSRNKFNKTLVEMMLNNKDLPKEFFDNVEKDLGWDKRGRFTGICIKINKDEDTNYFKLKKDIYTQINNSLGINNYLSTDRFNEIFIFFKLQEADYLKDIVNKINSSINKIKNKNSISIGVSNVYNNLSEMEKLYNESYLAALFSNNDITYYNLLDTMKLLYPLKNDKEVKLYYEKTIEKLNNYDIKNKISLLNTLEVYFENNMNKKITAEQLFIHVETLRYRLNRIEEITSYSLSDIEGIFALKMGLKLQSIMNLK